MASTRRGRLGARLRQAAHPGPGLPRPGADGAGQRPAGRHPDGRRAARRPTGRRVPLRGVGLDPVRRRRGLVRGQLSPDRRHPRPPRHPRRSIRAAGRRTGLRAEIAEGWAASALGCCWPHGGRRDTRERGHSLAQPPPGTGRGHAWRVRPLGPGGLRGRADPQPLGRRWPRGPGRAGCRHLQRQLGVAAPAARPRPATGPGHQRVPAVQLRRAAASSTVARSSTPLRPWRRAPSISDGALNSQTDSYEAKRRHDGHLGELAYWRANAARASVARSTNASPLTSMKTRLMVPPTNGQGASPA
jgi:hypothetical protein